MQFRVFGNGSGISPTEGFHHTCTAIETEHGLYFIDAGELGAYTAHLCGADLLKTRAVFITHSHMDHVGGLGNLLWYIRKIAGIRKTSVYSGNIDICAPEKDVFDATMLLLKNTEGDFACDYSHTFREVSEDFRYTSADGELTVTAVHTDHLPQRDGRYRSYAFLTELEGKRLVFMGDMRLEDVARVLPEDGADALFVETGHYEPQAVCEAVKAAKKPVGTLFFIHHGKTIRQDIPAAQSLVEEVFGKNAVITQEGHSYSI